MQSPPSKSHFYSCHLPIFKFFFPASTLLAVLPGDNQTQSKTRVRCLTVSLLFVFLLGLVVSKQENQEKQARKPCLSLSLSCLYMEGSRSREGIAVASGHEAAAAPAGYGLFIRTADFSMAEAAAQQEAAAAAKGYRSSPSSPSSMSPTPSPPPAAAVHGGGGAEDAAAAAAVATPAARSLGAGDSSSMQVSGHGEHAGLSSGRRRGRPKGSGRRQILANLGQYILLLQKCSVHYMIFFGFGKYPVSIFFMFMFFLLVSLLHFFWG